MQTKGGGGSVFGIPLFNLERAYEEALVNGGVQTTIMLGAGFGDIPPALADLVNRRIEAMIDRAYKIAHQKYLLSLLLIIRINPTQAWREELQGGSFLDGHLH